MKLYFHFLILLFCFGLKSAYANYSVIQDETLTSKNGIVNDEKITRLLEKLSEAKRADDNQLINEALDSITDIFTKNMLYQKAIFYLKKADSYSSDSLRKGVIKFKIGSNFYAQSKFDSARYYYDKALTALPENSKDYHSKIYNNLAAIHFYSEEYNLSANYFEKALEIQKEQGNVKIQTALLNNIGGIHYMNDKYHKAKNCYLEVIRILDTIQPLDEDFLNTKKLAYFNLSDVYEDLKNYEKALFYKNEFLKLKEGLEKDIRSSQVSEIENKYKEEKSKNDLEIAKNKRIEAQYMSLIFLLALVIICIFLWALIYYKKLKISNLNLQKSRENIKKINKKGQIEKQKVAEVTSSTLDRKEVERKVIAQTLHDSISALLASANLHLTASVFQMQNQVPDEILKTQKIIEEASEKISELSHSLFSAVLLNFGLNHAIQDLVDKYSDSDLEILYKSAISERYFQSFEFKLYHIIEELLDNIKQHSEASHALITIREIDSSLEIKISDDGKGFDKDEVELKEGIGLSQISLRIKAMKGVIAINSEVGSGTVIYISVPVEKELEMEEYI
ncbi:tetratricopeptide repeat-containing sensor histidine kinase [Aureivirga sp. CE67]|uniref:tetratricopeptide repeat-containing sensor histidine kinase n=1 Tax=Aureivirga sp. CE67 TaxID=1788983 RepID=UPI0018CB8B44|nr:tetratricopeptide repeat-containing sensor histidine kinase [Aureivirga sp. CE67]